MDPKELRSKLNGVIAFPVTPFHQDFSVDLEGLRHNLEFLLQHDLCAIVPAAGTGEMFSLSPDENLAILKITLEVVNGRIPVLAAAGFNHALAPKMASNAQAAGAQGILCFPPYYPLADPSGMQAYYESIAAAVDLGIIIYSRDWATFTPHAVSNLCSIPNLIAWKDGQGDIRKCQMIMEKVGDHLHWIGGAGDDLVPGYYSLGIRTYTSSIANVDPRLSLRLHQLASTGFSVQLNELMRQCVVPLYRLRARRKGYEVSAMKTMMDMVGLRGGLSRPPLVEVNEEEKQQLKGLLSVWKTFLG